MFNAKDFRPLTQPLQFPECGTSHASAKSTATLNWPLPFSVVEDGWIDRTIKSVDEILAKSRMSELQPIAAPLDSEIQAAIERAKRLGTYKQIDRSAQYRDAHNAQPGAILKAVNALGTHTRALQAEKERMQHKMNLQLRNSVIVAIVTALVTAAATVAVTHLSPYLR